MIRQGSIDDINAQQFLKISNYEDTVRQLDIYYAIVKRQLLRFQSPITGLFPVLSSDLHIGSVRDSIYCAAAVWGLYQAYRRIDDDRGKSHELGQSTVKCMRGILECWVKQSARVEAFKTRQMAAHALHVKFHLTTGEPVLSDNQYHHLQIDVVSLYLLFLVQMITSGLQIIYTQDEVAFIQNLVYYVERAYRTPDYGMWERGSKYNDGKPEIHASSIGMAKAALEAINGCNLFGDKGASWSVVYVDIDAHNRNRSIFETMLPRESSSKGVDVALLPTISFPAFATHEDHLFQLTKSNILRRLQGKYGFKRFSRDGYKCVLEDPTRRYYNEGELKEFDGIESEWPLFYVMMIIDGVFRTLPDQVEEYQRLLKARIYMDEFGDPVIPWFYYVPREGIENERNEPYSVRRMPANQPGDDSKDTGGLFLWAQSMFVLAQLLTGGLLHVNELDPIRRYLPSYNRPRRAGRYSAFQAKPAFGIATDLVVQVVLIAESMRLQAMMGTYGIQTQTPHEVEPVQICSSTQLVHVYRQLGVCPKLKLTGRPIRPVGSLGTSKIYRVCGMTVLCYPLIFEVSEFYLYRDMALLIDDIKTELQFVGKYWRLSGRPTVCLLVREEHMRDPHFKQMLDLFAMLKKGHCDGVKVRLGRLQNLISSSCMEHLDFMSQGDFPSEMFTQFRQLEHEYIGYQSLTDVPRTLTYREENLCYDSYKNRSTADVVAALRGTDNIFAQCQLWGILKDREGAMYEVNGTTALDALKSLYHSAGVLRHWRAVRYCSSLLNHTVDSISPFITTVLVNGKQLTVGVIGQKETVFDKPMTPGEIQSVMYSTIQPYDVIGAVLQQEIVLYCGRLIGTSPEMFRGILKIRVGWVLEAIRTYLRLFPGEARAGAPLEALSPYRLRTLLQRVLTVSDWADEEGLTPLQRRQLEGCLCRVPKHFYIQVWDILLRTPKGITIHGHCIPACPTLVNMSRSELSFALLVEGALVRAPSAARRQLCVELLCVVAAILRRNPELCLQALDLDKLLQDAHHTYAKVCPLLLFLTSLVRVLTAVCGTLVCGGRHLATKPRAVSSGARP
ncbi:probable phosphorylase b kinase regulatory subunit beta isoform X2 [Cydia pomonella]|uniref:probable phosphorylase b kinase regulatory subunit beta isoform X2 n=1 Tax=Cydia pomonella TaxID=82600 RepID=UPI002ADDA61A|nr:probable phosphorylase b kinase regulatory subunit beta isoform X2 [Cydia pomonella]XP_061707433.1 probable phosphorylase b kinase regulatory subunit beta isoform X2 [Cydia pomonella]